MPLYKRPDSPFWWVKIGRKTRESTHVRHATEPKAKAEEYERVLAERLWRLEKLGDRGAISFQEAAERWLDGSARPKRRDRELLDWLNPEIGIEQVREVADPEVIEQLRKRGIAAGWSHSTVDRLMGTLSAVLKDCERRGEITAPAFPMYRKPAGEPRALTPAELDALCWQLPMHLALAARVAVHTLLRMRAMLQLTWSRVDLEQRRAWVPSAHQKAARTFGLPLNSEAVRALRALRMLSGPKSAHVFTWQGAPIDDCNGSAFLKATKRAGVAPLRWHDLRHTGASWAVQNGVTLPELMLLGDWRDYRSVLRYAHLAPSQAAAAADKLAQWAAAPRGHARGHTRKRARRAK
ncbi:MAG TPA: tyrosine-type recombinase/integrase [Polyangiaceae bacterium]|nr:tyrosine-type recombinase/integrase [Polyangiaceae bacterium]